MFKLTLNTGSDFYANGFISIHHSVEIKDGKDSRCDEMVRHTL